MTTTLAEAAPAVQLAPCGHPAYRHRADLCIVPDCPNAAYVMQAVFATAADVLAEDAPVVPASSLPLPARPAAMHTYEQRDACNCVSCIQLRFDALQADLEKLQTIWSVARRQLTAGQINQILRTAQDEVQLLRARRQQQQETQA